jgi:hypothetical protein
MCEQPVAACAEGKRAHGGEGIACTSAAARSAERGWIIACARQADEYGRQQQLVQPRLVDRCVARLPGDRRRLPWRERGAHGAEYRPCARVVGSERLPAGDVETAACVAHHDFTLAHRTMQAVAELEDVLGAENADGGER